MWGHFFDHNAWGLMLGLGGGLACGFLNTAASSGSAVSLPILMLVGLDPLSANATNRIPVLLGAISASLSFHKKKTLPWAMAFSRCRAGRVRQRGRCTPGGATALASARTRHHRRLLVALVLLFSKLKQAIEQVNTEEARFSVREVLIFFGIGLWLGFIVLDGATYLLLALTLAVGLNLLQANAIKSAVLVPTTLIAMIVFAYNGHIDWDIGLFMGAGSIVGGMLGARVATTPQAKRYVFGILVVAISAELVQLILHYVFQTH